MTINKWFPMMAVLMTLASMGAGQAAEKIRYEDLRKRLGPYMLAYRGFTVVTLDGKKHRSRSVVLEPDHLSLYAKSRLFEHLPSAQISRIEISQRGRFFHHVVASAWWPLGLAAYGCGDEDQPGPPGCRTIHTAMWSPLWAYTATIAPFCLAADGVAFLIPPKVYEVAQ
jgi:hypothetical protein